MALAKGQRELQRGRDAVREEEKQVEALRAEAEAAQGQAREAREAVEREREDMMKGFSEVRVALEVGNVTMAAYLVAFFFSLALPSLMCLACACAGSAAAVLWPGWSYAICRAIVINHTKVAVLMSCTFSIG